MALAGLAALTGRWGRSFFWRGACVTSRDADAIPAWPLGGVIGCVVLTFVLRLQALEHPPHYAAFQLEPFLRSRLARKALQLPPGVLTANGQRVKWRK